MFLLIMSIEKGDLPQEPNRFSTAKSLIAVSDLEPSVQEDTLQVAVARALYVRSQLAQGKKVEQYEGRNPGAIEVATNSVLVDLNRPQS
jgi:hypothetical protein